MESGQCEGEKREHGKEREKNDVEVRGNCKAGGMRGQKNMGERRIWLGDK